MALPKRKLLHSSVNFYHCTCTYKMTTQNDAMLAAQTTVELQWLEHLWNHKNMFETGVVPAKKY